MGEFRKTPKRENERLSGLVVVLELEKLALHLSTLLAVDGKTKAECLISLSGESATTERIA